MPAHLSKKSERVAVELDGLTARILRYLYPQIQVFNQGFEAASLPRNYFDLILSNIPFGDFYQVSPQCLALLG